MNEYSALTHHLHCLSPNSPFSLKSNRKHHTQSHTWQQHLTWLPENIVRDTTTWSPHLTSFAWSTRSTYCHCKIFGPVFSINLSPLCETFPFLEPFFLRLICAIRKKYELNRTLHKPEQLVCSKKGSRKQGHNNTNIAKINMPTRDRRNRWFVGFCFLHIVCSFVSRYFYFHQEETRSSMMWGFLQIIDRRARA